MIDNMRCFIGILLDLPTQKTIEAKWLSPLKATLPDTFRWIPLSNLHLTLRFLGLTESTKIPALIQALEKVASQFQPFRLDLEKIDYFPNYHPKVLAITLTPSKILTQLTQAIELQMRLLDFKEEESFVGHITVARFREKNNLPLALTCCKLNIKVSSFWIIESQHSSQGVTYKGIKKILLEKGK